jgi:hypothetical protein
MNIFRHTVNSKKLLFLISNNPAYVFIQISFKYGLNINLAGSVCHHFLPTRISDEPKTIIDSQQVYRFKIKHGEVPVENRRINEMRVEKAEVIVPDETFHGVYRFIDIVGVRCFFRILDGIS